MEEKKKTLKNKILDLKKEVSIMQKDASGYGYKYVTEESILNKINGKMIEEGIKLTPMFVPGTLHTEVVNYTDAKGKAKTDVLVNAEMRFKWEDINTGEEEIIDWILVGQQADGSQALGSALTYANRYFLLKYFNVATSEDDPDKVRSELQAEEERKIISATQTKVKKLFNNLVTKYQTKEKLYEILGSSKEDFVSKFNDSEKCKSLLEQLELIEKSE